MCHNQKHPHKAGTHTRHKHTRNIYVSQVISMQSKAVAYIAG